ncbi:MAG: tubulin-like doman-containing protein [Candidatus Calescibacterium sp.]|nr:tubulin-like doman-containing protein [Candidatus Calescibacterium sp.]MDW8132774.1 tubulin-like doman-containing protein [Candidatus Calescibacterium sp.]
MEFSIPTIVIGLGGTGLKTVVNLKKRVGDIGKGLLKFLCIDSDKNEVLVNELEPDEYINVGVPGVSAIISNLKSETAEFVRPWFPSNLNFKVVAGDEGAKQFRPMGRLYLFKNIDRVFNAIDMVTKQLRAKFADVRIASKTINVYIVSSTCGGTGSGMLLDMAYVVRKVIEEENAVSALVKGILFLPTAFHPFPISDEAERKHIFANGYATLKEIDYYMNPSKETEYNVQFSQTRVVRSKKQPFDVCYVVDDENEEFPIGSLDDTIRAVSESLVILLTSGVGTSIKSAEDNLFTVLSQSQKMQPYSEKNYLYSSFGTSSVIYPYDLVKKYVAGKLIKHMYDSLNRDIKSNHIFDIMKTLKIDEINSDDLINSLYSFKSFSSVELSEKIYQVNNSNIQITIKQKLLVEYSGTVDAIKERVEKNLDDFVKTKFEEFKNLIQEYITSPSMGFFLVYKILTDSEQGFPYYFEKVKEMLRKEIEDHNNQVSKLARDVDFYSNTLIEKSNSMFARIFNKKDKKLIEGFSKSLSDMNNHIVYATLKEYAILFYNKFNMLVQRYINDVIEGINNVWQKFYNDYVSNYLKITFESKPGSWGNKINFYVANKEIIDKDVDMIIQNDKNRIVSYLYKIFDNFVNLRYDKFKNYEEEILNFIENNYRDYLYMDIEDQVVSIFGGEDEVVSKLSRASSILYRYKSQLFNDSYVKYYKVLGVKNVNNSRFFNISKLQNIEVIENYNPFRISMLQVKHGLPLYSFVLMDIMEKSYMELINTDPGLHIDPFYQRVENLSIDYEILQQDFQKYLYVYLGLILEIIKKEGMNFVVYLDGVKLELGDDKQEVVTNTIKKLNDNMFASKFISTVESVIQSMGEESIKLTVKDYVSRNSNRLYYLKNKKNLTKEEVNEMDYLEKEIKVLKKFIDSVSV